MGKPRAQSQPFLADPEAVLRATKEPDFRQDRARRSYLALIDAATELFAKHGYDAVGTPEIALRAEVSVGTFYRYFEDKHVIYLEVARRSMLEGYAQSIGGLTAAAFVGKNRRDTIDVSLTVVLDMVLLRPALSRSFLEMSLRDPAVAELRRAIDQLSISRLAMLIGAVSKVPDPEAAAYVLHAMVMECAY
ncbi:MAG: helix-turn-helix domain containing protein, partial [Proteobacteria bacterium]|nr:helix-turn-helix domain containing protein [Pseudomonadota bacterium]